MNIAKQQSGFTLIELISVLAIMGILAAVAVPRFVDLSDTARAANAASLASSLSGASSLNYAAAIARDTGLDPDADAKDVTDCPELVNLVSAQDQANFGDDKIYKITTAVKPKDGAGADVEDKDRTTGMEMTCRVTENRSGSTNDFVVRVAVVN